jgi:ubiquinone/menaquinone biosynthesis C-methylase UbiE
MIEKNLCASYYDKAAATYDTERFSCECREFVDSLFKKTVYQFIANKESVLDAGTGTGRFALYFSGFGKHVFAMDASKPMLDKAKANATRDGLENNIDFIPGNIENIPLDDDKVDAITCIHVLVHYRDIEKAIAEFARVLKPGGHLVIEVANSGLSRIYHKIWAILSRRAHFSYPDYYHNSQYVENTLVKYGIAVIHVKKIKKIPKVVLHPLLCMCRFSFIRTFLDWFERYNFGSVTIMCGKKNQ